MRGSSARKRLSFALRIIVTLLLLAWIVRLVDTAEVRTALSRAHPVFVVLVLLTVNADRVLMAYKWNLLLAAKRIHLPFFSVLGTYYVTSFWGSFLLPTIGADALRSFVFARRTGLPEDVISSVVMERALGVLAVCAVCLLSLALFLSYVDAPIRGFRHLPLAVIVVVALFLLSLARGWVSLLPRRLRRSEGRIVAGVMRVVDSYQGYSHHRGTLLRFLAWSIPEQLLAAVSAYFVARALFLDISPWFFVMFVPIATAAGRLPISIDGFGVREGTLVYLFSLVGLSESQALLIGLLNHLAMRLGTIPLVLFFMAIQAEPVRVHEDGQAEQVRS